MGKRADQKAATRAKLIETARELFTAKGFEAVGMREIAAAAGVSTGAIFFNFESKEVLWAEVMERPAPNVRAFLENLTRGVEHVETLAQALLSDLFGPGA